MLAFQLLSGQQSAIMHGCRLCLKGGNVGVNFIDTYSLQEVGKAHELLESRKTTGSTVLRPSLATVDGR